MEENEKLTEKLLVREIIDGNEKAFRKLYDTYSGSLYAYCFSILKSKTYSEEIIQDVFLKVWSHRKNLDPDLSFKSYIYTITRNLSFNFLSKAANNKNLREEIFYKSQNSYNSTEDYMANVEYTILKNNAIETLPPKCKLIFQMSRNEGKSYKDISKELGISISTVKGQMGKALGIMRNFLQTKSDITLLLAVILLELANRFE